MLAEMFTAMPSPSSTRAFDVAVRQYPTFHTRLMDALCFPAMSRLLLFFAALSLFAIPLLSQTPTTTTPASAASPAIATRTAPPPGFTQTIVLWPEGAPLAHGTTEGDIPKLFTYPAAGAGPHSAVVVMPGGGYTHLVMPQEGAQEAQWLAAHGISAFVLEYRLSPAYVYPAPMLDASRAIRYVRSHAAELSVKPDAIGVWGFSAGGHLSGYMATIHKAGDPSAADPIDRVGPPRLCHHLLRRTLVGPLCPRWHCSPANAHWPAPHAGRYRRG